MEENDLCECDSGYYGDNCEHSFIKCNIEEDCNPDNTIDVSGYKKKDGSAITEEEGVQPCKCMCSDFTTKSPCYKDDLIINTDDPESSKRWENMLQISYNKCLKEGICESASNSHGFVCSADTYISWSKDPCDENPEDCSLGIASYDNEDKSYIQCNQCPMNTSTYWKINQPGLWEGCSSESPELCPQSYNITDCMCIERGGYYFSDNNKKNSFRSKKQIAIQIEDYSKDLIFLNNNTKNIVEYVKKTTDNNKKNYYFWELINHNE